MLQLDLIPTDAIFAMLPPLAILELIWIRVLMTDLMRDIGPINRRSKKAILKCTRLNVSAKRNNRVCGRIRCYRVAFESTFCGSSDYNKDIPHRRIFRAGRIAGYGHDGGHRVLSWL